MSPNPGAPAAVTLCTANQIHRARVLMDSIGRHWPAAARFVLLLDDPPAPTAEIFPGCTVLRPGDLGLADFEELAFANGVTGLCCLLKPFAALQVLHTGCPVVAYFDSDTWLLHPPDALAGDWEGASVLLTPHALHPYPDGAVRCDRDLLVSGAFNAGFFAVRNDDAGAAFLGWWKDRLHAAGFLEPAQQYDQSWLNLAPVLFPGVRIWRNPAYNVGFWNYYERRAQPGFELVLLHLSLFQRAHPGRLVSADWLRLPAPPELAGLLQQYSAALAAEGAADFERLPYRYGRFTNGAPVTVQHRYFYRERIFRRCPGEGSPFSPGFRAGPHRGVFSLYRAADRWPRALRRLARLATRTA